MRLIALAAIFALGALLANLLFAHPPARLVFDLAQPVVVATWWGTYGLACVAVLVVTATAAFIPYLKILQRVPSLKATLATSVIALLIALAWHPIFSSDVYAYAAYGEMSAHGVNPYLHNTLLASDPLVRDARWQWSGPLPVCVYGDAFVILARIAVTAFRTFGAVAQLDVLRILACCAFVIAAMLLARCGTPLEQERGRRAAAFLALNPVAIWSAAEGHNDALMIACAIGGVALARSRPMLGSFVATTAALIKAPALAAGAALATMSWLERRSLRGLAGFTGGALLVTIGAIPLVYGVKRDLAPHGHYLPLVSVQSIHPLVAVAIALVLLPQLVRARSTVDRLLMGALIAWLAIPNPYPWYCLWLLPLAAWATDRAIVLTTLLVTSLALLRYVPDAVAIPSPAIAALLGVVALLGYTPLLTRAIISRP